MTALAGVGVSELVLDYTTSGHVAGATSPFEFVNGGDFATASSLGFVVNSYPNAQQVSVSSSVSGADGAYGTYLLDVLELQSTGTSTVAWNLSFSVVAPLVATGVSAAYFFACTTVPTGVPVSGTPLASGTDANGNPWAIFPPTCAGTSSALSLLSAGAGTLIPLAGTTAGATVLYCSFALAVTNTGSSTTTAAQLVLSASA